MTKKPDGLEEGRIFRETFSAECDVDYFATLAIKYKRSALGIAQAASYTLGTWDGHHRLSLALRDLFELVANERSINKQNSK